MNKYKRNYLITLLFIPIVIIGGIGYMVIRYYNVCYKAQQASDLFERARSVNDIDELIDYSQEGLDKLKGYSGNPCWWFQGADTDWDSMKSDVKEIISTAKKVNVSVDSDAYQEALDNCKEGLEKIQEQIKYTNRWLYWDGLFHLFFWIWLFIYLIFLPSIAYNIFYKHTSWGKWKDN